MARMLDYLNGILPCQEAFLVDAPTSTTSPHRWIQAKRAGGGGSLPPLTSTHSRCEPRAVARHFVAGIGQQPFRLVDQFFMQVRLLFEDGVDI